jgi:hypothetical protein
MASVARIWVVGPGAELPAPLTEEGASVHERGGPRAAPREPGPQVTPAPEALARWLDALAARHPGGELVVVGDADLAAACVALVLGVECGAVAADGAALDWPAEGTDLERARSPVRASSQDPATRGAPQLVGVDLDWVPPLARAQPRFPGGPGVAGTARG